MYLCPIYDFNFSTSKEKNCTCNEGVKSLIATAQIFNKRAFLTGWWGGSSIAFQQEAKKNKWMSWHVLNSHVVITR